MITMHAFYTLLFAKADGQMVLDLLLSLPTVQNWADIQMILKKACSKKPRDWQLPVLACKAVGGNNELAVPAAAAIACLQISIILVDDLLDSDPRGEHHRIGMPATANLAIAFHAIGLDAIGQGNVNQATKLVALNSLNRMMLTTAFGQYMDVQGPKDEDEYWRIIRNKSCPFFGSALYVGALMGGATPDDALQMEQFGHLYGEMIQIHDDLNDTMAVPANPDWTLDRAPLPILFAQVVNHDDNARFLELRKTIPDPAALTEAQTILIRCGAVSYCIDQILRRHQAAQKILRAMSTHHKEELEDLLDGVVDPVRKLLEAINIPLTDSLLQPPD
jgi:geranylgeranyl pyrophosphate synthase